MHTVKVLDKGPSKPKSVDKSASEQEQQEYEALRREHDEWHKSNKEPARVEMDSMNASEAVARDPERYAIDDARPVAAKLLLEDRVANLERWAATWNRVEPLPPPGKQPMASADEFGTTSYYGDDKKKSK